MIIAATASIREVAVIQLFAVSVMKAIDTAKSSTLTYKLALFLSNLPNSCIMRFL